MTTGQHPKRRDTDSQVEFRRDAARIQQAELEAQKLLPPIVQLNRADRRRIGIFNRRQEMRYR